jgi:hypothetical protein
MTPGQIPGVFVVPGQQQLRQGRGELHGPAPFSFFAIVPHKPPFEQTGSKISSANIL